MAMRSIDKWSAEQAQRTASEPILLTVSEVARQLRVDDTTVRRWLKQGALEAVVLPHVGDYQTYRIHRSTLEKLLS
jgi:excisionase family DNA binding protein